MCALAAASQFADMMSVEAITEGRSIDVRSYYHRVLTWQSVFSSYTAHAVAGPLRFTRSYRGPKYGHSLRSNQVALLPARLGHCRGANSRGLGPSVAL